MLCNHAPIPAFPRKRRKELRARAVEGAYKNDKSLSFDTFVQGLKRRGRIIGS